MTTITVARKGGQVAIAADSLVTFGETRLSHGYEANDKLFRVGASWFGLAGTTAHFSVLRRALSPRVLWWVLTGRGSAKLRG